VPVAAVGAHLRARLPAALRAGVEQLLAAAPPAGDPAEARARLLALRGADQALSVGLLLRLPPSAPLWALLRHNGLLRGAVLIALGHAAEVGAAVGGAALLARGALVGQLAAGWLGGWALLALGAALLRGAVLWAEGAWALRLGALLRRRLLVGALHLPADQVRRSGLGQLLGTTLEAEALDALGPAGGALALFALLELGAALALLLVGAGGLPHALALLVWSLGVGVGIIIFARRRARWSAGRLRLTHRLVEALVGHRTRLAQELPARWHLREDDALCTHQAAAAPMDRAAALLSALAPGGWTALGLAALGPAALAGAPPAALALGLAGVIAGAGALRKLGWGAAALIDAGVALAQVRPLLSAAAAAPRPPRPRPLPPVPLEAPLEARGLRLRHPGRARAALDGVDLQIARGDHLLLLGPSGAGKSTLAAVLAGARAPDAGLLLVGGLDPRALGPDGWRAAVGLVPQFHENHVFATTLAFNLLLGQDWPPAPEALDAAEELCEALGLGPLLRRMPGGLLQLVGETGWRLSHGEQSRVFLGRGLLSGAQIVILDESLAALDPATLSRCLEVVRARAPAAVLIAHP
jgi:ATP-binding cassette subfamily B protein